MRYAYNQYKPDGTFESWNEFHSDHALQSEAILIDLAADVQRFDDVSPVPPEGHVCLLHVIGSNRALEDRTQTRLVRVQPVVQPRYVASSLDITIAKP